MKIFGIIYKATNMQNKKVYIGQTSKTLEYRIKTHKSSMLREDGFVFHRALKKYGMKNFTWEILGNCFSKEELNTCEKECISFFNSFNKLYGYNIHLGGTGGDTITNNPNKQNIIKKVKKSINSNSVEQKEEKVRKWRKSYIENGNIEKQSQRLKTLFNLNPDIFKNREKKRQNTITNNYNDFYKCMTEKRMKTEQNNLEIQKKRSESYKKTIQKNPEITKNRVLKFKDTLNKNPEIRKIIGSKVSEFYKNNPEIKKNVIEKRLKTEKNNPNISKQRIETYKKTLQEHPEICKNRGLKYKEDCIIRNNIKDTCFVLIQKYNICIDLLNKPSNSAGSKKWEIFKNNLLQYIN